MQQDEPVLT